MTTDREHPCSIDGCRNTTIVKSYRIVGSDEPAWLCKEHADEFIANGLVLSSNRANYRRANPRAKSGDTLADWRASNEEVDELVRQAREKKRSEP